MRSHLARPLLALLSALALLAGGLLISPQPAGANGGWDVTWDVENPAGMKTGDVGKVTFGAGCTIHAAGVSALGGYDHPDGTTQLMGYNPDLEVDGNEVTFTIDENASGVLFISSRLNSEDCPSENVTAAFPLAKAFRTFLDEGVSVSPEDPQPGSSPTYTFPVCETEEFGPDIVMVRNWQLFAIDGPIWGEGLAQDLPNYQFEDSTTPRGPNPVEYEIELAEDVIGLYGYAMCSGFMPEEGWSLGFSAGWGGEVVIPTSTEVLGEPTQQRSSASVDVVVTDGPETSVGELELFVDGAGEPFASSGFDAETPWTVDLSSLEPGEHTLVATYSGGEDESGTYGGSTSAPFDVEIVQETSIEITEVGGGAFETAMTAVLADGPDEGGWVEWWIDGELALVTEFEGNPVEAGTGELGPGYYVMTATYTGSDGYGVSTSEPYAFEVGTGFVDVPIESPFATPIAWMNHQGISTGYPGDIFQPTLATARQAMVTFIWRLAGSPEAPPGHPTFSDVPADNPFYEAISWAAATGIANGYEDGTFQPSAPTTRQAASAFVYRYAFLA